MLEKTLSLWRRLVHQPEGHAEAVPAAAVQDDRRLWVRHSADLPAQVEPAGNGQRLSARVLDISVGGAQLQVGQRFDSGRLLTLELPDGREGARTVLACVVRSIPQGENSWSVGCVFSRELTQDDLEAFGVSRRSEEDEQRIWKRFDCALTAQYQRVGSSDASYAGQVLNISTSGIGLLVNQTLEAGNLLSVDLFDKRGEPVRSILACVVHTTARPGGELAVGCNFIRELGEDDLQALL